jgi:hypothetical protein
MAQGHARNAQLIYSLATQRGLSPQRARELVSASLRESGLNAGARNASSGAAGLFQLLSSGYRNRAMQLGGLNNPRANLLAILPAYLSYWRKHPNAAPGEGAAAVEASGKNAAWYAQPLGHLQGYNLGAGFPRQDSGSAPQVPPLNPPAQGNRFLQAVLRGEDLTEALPGILAQRRSMAMPSDGVVSPSQPNPGSTGYGTPAELFYRDMALKFGKHIGAIPGHYDHVHAAYTNPQQMLRAISLARSLGLNIGENPEVGTVHPVHATHSYHYRDFPGLYHGRHLGEAIDVSGNAAKMLRFYRMLAGG